MIGAETRCAMSMAVAVSSKWLMGIGLFGF